MNTIRKWLKRFSCLHPNWEETFNPWVAYSYDEWKCRECGKKSWFRFDRPPVNLGTPESTAQDLHT